MIVRCKECGKEIAGQPGKTLACGCPNMMTVNEDSVTAVDLTRTIMVRSNRLEEKPHCLQMILPFKNRDVSVKCGN